MVLKDNRDLPPNNPHSPRAVVTDASGWGHCLYPVFPSSQCFIQNEVKATQISKTGKLYMKHSHSAVDSGPHEGRYSALITAGASFCRVQERRVGYQGVEFEWFSILTNRLGHSVTGHVCSHNTPDFNYMHTQL